MLQIYKLSFFTYIPYVLYSIFVFWVQIPSQSRESVLRTLKNVHPLCWLLLWELDSFHWNIPVSLAVCVCDHSIPCCAEGAHSVLLFLKMNCSVHRYIFHVKVGGGGLKLSLCHHHPRSWSLFHCACGNWPNSKIFWLSLVVRKVTHRYCICCLFSSLLALSHLSGYLSGEEKWTWWEGDYLFSRIEFENLVYQSL